VNFPDPVADPISGFLIKMSLTPTVPTGVDATISVSLTEKTLAYSPSIITDASGRKPVPVIAIVVPPEVVPDEGETPVKVGASINVGPEIKSDRPKEFATKICGLPTGRAGVVQAIEFGEIKTTDVQLTPPTEAIVFILSKPLPVMVITVPPEVSAYAGEIPVKFTPTSALETSIRLFVNNKQEIKTTIIRRQDVYSFLVPNKFKTTFEIGINLTEHLFS
jgi:hypothetical protein